MRTKEFVGHCILEAGVETNVPRGGHSGYGGQTVIRLRNAACADLGTRPVHNSEGKIAGVEICAAGDDEAHRLVEALLWVAAELHRQITTNAASSPGLNQEPHLCPECGSEWALLWREGLVWHCFECDKSGRVDAGDAP